MTNKKFTAGTIGEIYNTALSPILSKYDQMEVIRITKDFHLLADGVVKEQIDLTFLYNGEEPLDAFPWHCPYITENTKILGIRVKPNIKVKGLRSTRQEKLQLIEIKLDNVGKGEFVHLLFEYYATETTLHKKGFLYNKIYYPLAFLPADSVESIDIRVHIPGKNKLEFDINLPEFFVVCDDEKQVLLTSQENSDLVRDIHGFISVSYKKHYFDVFLSVLIGTIFATIALVLPDFKVTLGGFYYIIIVSFSFLVTVLAYRLFSKN